MTRECSADLRTMIDKVIKNLRVLSTIDLPLDPLSEMFIVNMVAHRLDNETRKAYELQLKPQIYPKWAELLTFLKSRCHILECIENSRPAINKPAKFQQATPSSSQYSKPTQKSSSSTKINALLSSAKIDFKCWVCEKPHYITQCKEFLSMAPENRQTTVRKLNLFKN
jgi:hypothetical protein